MPVVVGMLAVLSCALRRVTRSLLVALKGLLQRDGCADVVQLLGRQNKTGVLRLRSSPEATDIWIQNGLIIRVDNLSKDARHRLGELLIRAGLLSRQALDHALDLQKASGKRLGSVLMEAGYVDRKTLIDFVKLQARETLFNAFLITKGTYEFIADLTTKPAAELGTGLRWEHALMEGVRRLGEWPEIKKSVPTKAHTFRVLQDLPEGPAPSAEPNLDDAFSFAGLDDDPSSGLEAPPPNDGFPAEEDHLVFALVRPGATVQRLIDQSYLGEFETCRVLHNLVKRGYLEPVEEEEELSATDVEVVLDDGPDDPDLPPLVNGNLLDSES